MLIKFLLWRCKNNNYLISSSINKISNTQLFTSTMLYWLFIDNDNNETHTRESSVSMALGCGYRSSWKLVELMRKHKACLTLRRGIFAAKLAQFIKGKTVDSRWCEGQGLHFGQIRNTHSFDVALNSIELCPPLLPKTFLRLFRCNLSIKWLIFINYYFICN